MNVLKNKKGIALESTLIFMMIIFSLCFLVASFALIGHYQSKIDNSMIMNRVELDQIGEDFLANDLKPEYEGYTIAAAENSLTVWRQNDADKTVVLYVKVDGSRNPLIWQYSAP